MAEMKQTDVRVVLIGDIVGSRLARDRRRVHRLLTAQLERVNAELVPVDPVDVTAGDEFQGGFGRLGQALAAVGRIRWGLLPDVDLRFGVGRGEVTVLDPRTNTQDGPAWWAARDAIHTTEELAARPATSHTRTTYRSAPDDPYAPAVNAALLCQDHMVGSLDDRSIRILRGLMSDQTQVAIAEAEGISPPAVSQRVIKHGLDIIVSAQRRLEMLS